MFHVKHLFFPAAEVYQFECVLNVKIQMPRPTQKTFYVPRETLHHEFACIVSNSVYFYYNFSS